MRHGACVCPTSACSTKAVLVQCTAAAHGAITLCAENRFPTPPSLCSAPAPTSWRASIATPQQAPMSAAPALPVRCSGPTASWQVCKHVQFGPLEAAR